MSCGVCYYRHLGSISSETKQEGEVEKCCLGASQMCMAGLVCSANHRELLTAANRTTWPEHAKTQQD